MKKVIFISSLTISSFLTTNAKASDLGLSPYVLLKAGMGQANHISFLMDSYGYGLLGAVGAQYGFEKINLRLEFEFSKFRYKGDSSYDDPPFDKYDSSYTLDSNLYLANFNMEVLKGYKIRLYTGIGFGLASFEEERLENTYFYGHGVTFVDKYKRNSSSFAAGLNAGVNFNVTDNWIGDIGLRCVDFATKDRIRICDATIGARYSF